MIRVLIVDDEALVRTGLRMILQSADDVEVAGEASDGRDAVDATRRHRPDVVLMDVRMPSLNRLPHTPKVIMLTSPQDLLTAVRTVAAGSAMLAPTVTKRLISTFATRYARGTEAAQARLAVLTNRELDVVRAVADGLSNAEIGRLLSMTEGTVKAYVSRCLAKLQLSNRVQIAILARDAGLVT